MHEKIFKALRSFNVPIYIFLRVKSSLRWKQENALNHAQRSCCRLWEAPKPPQSSCCSRLKLLQMWTQMFRGFEDLVETICASKPLQKKKEPPPSDELQWDLTFKQEIRNIEICENQERWRSPQQMSSTCGDGWLISCLKKNLRPASLFGNNHFKSFVLFYSARPCQENVTRF